MAEDGRGLAGRLAIPVAAIRVVAAAPAFGVERTIQPGLGRDVLRFAGRGAGGRMVNAADVGVGVGIMAAVVAGIRWTGFWASLFGEELVDKAFRLAVRRRRLRPREMRRDRIRRDEGALAAVGVR